MSGHDNASAGKCPVHHGGSKQSAFAGRSNRDWWPNQLNLRVLHQHSAQSNPMDAGFTYAEAFRKLDFAAVKQDLASPVFIVQLAATQPLHRLLNLRSP